MNTGSTITNRALSLFAVSALVFFALPAASQPIQISSYADLCKIGVDAAYPLGGEYGLAANIDASSGKSAGGGAGFAPIGSSDAPFTGSFNGNGYKISGLYINRPGIANGRNVGLFGYAVGASFSRVVVAVDSVVGNSSVGALAGRAENSVFDSCIASGAVRGTSGGVGGLIGTATDVVITRSGTSGVVIGIARSGGLIGHASGGQVSKCYSSCLMESTAPAGNDDVMGGLIGYNEAHVTESYSTGSIKLGNRQVGGLIGYNGDEGTVIGCYSTASVRPGRFSYDTDKLGGLIGYNTGTVTNCYYEKAGGFVGDRIETSGYGKDVGGLIGANRGGTVTGCRVSNISVFGSINVGGLIGANYSGTVGWCYYKSSVVVNDFGELGTVVTPTDTVYAVAAGGGLIGLNMDTVIRSYSDSCYVKGFRTFTSGWGGLIGVNDSGATVTQCYSTGGAVSGGSQAGGLVGLNAGGSSITQCYSLNAVEDGYKAGGLVGVNDGNTKSKITECFSAGKVTGFGTDIGGLLGYDDLDLWGTSLNAANFWHIEASGGLENSGCRSMNGCKGLTTNQINSAPFIAAGWSVGDVWELEALSRGIVRFVYAAPPVSVFRDRPAVRAGGSSAFAPKIVIKGGMMDVSGAAGSNYRIRVIDMRGRVVARFNVTGSGRYALGRVSAGRYLFETRVNGKLINVFSHNI